MRKLMTGDQEPKPYPRFTATLLPHRSLSRKAFVAVVLTIAAANIGGVAVCASLGAWPVTGFMGLGVVLLYAALRLSYRTGQLTEKIDLTERELCVTRLHPSGKAESWNFNPYWVRFEHKVRENAAGELSLSSHGRKLVFGAFLSDGEKASLAASLAAALARQKSYSSIHLSEI